MIEKGIVGKGTVKVTDNNTAESMVSGTLPVFATPAMILLIEKTAFESLVPYLQEGESTVGTLLNIKHTAPSAVGSEITCRTELIEVDRSRFVFDVKVCDRAGEVGLGIHERFLVNNEKFMARARSKLE